MDFSTVYKINSLRRMGWVVFFSTFLLTCIIIQANIKGASYVFGFGYAFLGVSNIFGQVVVRLATRKGFPYFSVSGYACLAYLGCCVMLQLENYFKLPVFLPGWLFWIFMTIVQFVVDVAREDREKIEMEMREPKKSKMRKFKTRLEV